MTITLSSFLSVCAGITCVCVAGGWVIKIIKAVIKPAQDASTKINDDARRIADLEETVKADNEAINLLLKSNLVILGHLSTNNCKGEMAKMQKEIQDFLIDKNSLTA